MHTFTTTTLQEPFLGDSLAPGYKVSDLPILSAIRRFRFAVLERGNGSDDIIQEMALGLLEVVHSTMTGAKLAPRKIQSVSVTTVWRARDPDEDLLIEIVDSSGNPFKYQISSDTYLSKDPRLMECVKDAQVKVNRLQTAAADASQAEKDARASLLEAKSELTRLEELHDKL
jgi:hypothetical protein